MRGGDGRLLRLVSIIVGTLAPISILLFQLELYLKTRSFLFIL